MGKIIDMEGIAFKEAGNFPASKAVHWPSGVVYACDAHASIIIGLGKIMGSHIPMSYAPPESQCQNCINESNKPTDMPVEDGE